MKHLFATLAAALTGLGLAAGTASATSYTNTIAQMTAYIVNQMAAQNVPGLSIVLVDGPSAVWAAGFGYADREHGIAANADTVYHIGSCSKAFLGTAFMQLLDQGQVDLETNVTHYMPEYSMLERFTNSGPVTIRSLLNHHSGVPGDFFNGMITTRSRADYIPWMIDCLQNDYPFAPVDERSSYCNSGFLLLSDVVRRITGMPFSAAMDAMLLAPLGMNASSFEPDKPAIVQRLASSYNVAGALVPPETVNAQGSGSMFSSVTDLAKYIRMILANGQFNGQTLISSNGITTMTTPQLTNLPLNVTDAPQGLGWDNVSDYRLRYAGNVFWKDGATWFHSAFIGISRDLNLGVAVIQNTPSSLCDDIGPQALQWAILDKTGTHWPTNAFVPAPAPVTNRPQDEIEALAGLYVGNAGYHKIEAAPGSLTFIANAYSDAPIITTNIVPRANGWFSKTNSQDNQLAFTNLAGHAMLVLHEASGAFETVSPIGEYYLPGPMSPAWSHRTNSVYRMVDLHPYDYFWEPGQPQEKTLRFTTKDGALMTSWVMGVYVIEPTNNNLAFQRGTHYRKGGAVQVSATNGFERLQYSSYRFIDEAAIPTLSVPALVNGSIPFANGTQWYWFTGQAGKTYRARLTAPGQEFFARITDREGIVLGSGSNAPATWTCPANGSYAIAVSATNTFAFSLSLTVVGLRQAQSDYDGDEKADPATFDPATGALTVRLSGSSYAQAQLQMLSPPANNAQAASADYDGDHKADPAVYNPITDRLTALLSSQAYSLITMPIGGAGCTALHADFDGDRKSDPTVFDTANAIWQTQLSSSGYLPEQILFPQPAANSLQPAPEDYDGDGKTDPAVYATANGQWQLLLSASGYATASFIIQPSTPGLQPVSGDYDGDSKADPTIYQASGGVWLCALSSQGYAMGGITAFGGTTMTPRPGDYDNDGRTDPAVYDSATRLFYVLLSGSNYRLFSMPL